MSIPEEWIEREELNARIQKDPHALSKAVHEVLNELGDALSAAGVTHSVDLAGSKLVAVLRLEENRKIERYDW